MRYILLFILILQVLPANATHIKNHLASTGIVTLLGVGKDNDLVALRDKVNAAAEICSFLGMSTNNGSVPLSASDFTDPQFRARISLALAAVAYSNSQNEVDASYLRLPNSGYHIPANVADIGFATLSKIKTVFSFDDSSDYTAACEDNGVDVRDVLATGASSFVASGAVDHFADFVLRNAEIYNVNDVQAVQGCSSCSSSRSSSNSFARAQVQADSQLQSGQIVDSTGIYEIYEVVTLGIVFFVVIISILAGGKMIVVLVRASSGQGFDFREARNVAVRKQVTKKTEKEARKKEQRENSESKVEALKNRFDILRGKSQHIKIREEENRREREAREAYSAQVRKIHEEKYSPAELRELYDSPEPQDRWGG